MANLKNITELPVANSASGLNLIVNDSGTAKQIAASEVGAQADWNQNNPAAPDYIKNRPFYEVEQGIVEATLTINPGDVIDSSILDQIYEQRKTVGYDIGSSGDNFNYWFDNNGWKDIPDNYDGTEPYWLYNGVKTICVTRPSANTFVFELDNNAIPVSVTFNQKLLDVHKLDIRYLPDEVLTSKAPVMKPYVIDSEAYTYGDDALAAILEGRQILVKVPNKNGGTLFSNFMPVLQYQLPNDNNSYLILFYLKDGIADNIAAALQTGSFDGVYGVIQMMLSKTYTECPLKVNPIK